MLFFSFSSHAKTIYVDADANGNDNGRSWGNAFVDLQDALTNASAGDIIWVAEGTYTPGNSTSDYFRMKNGVSLYGGFNGTETATNQRNPLIYKSVISGEIGTSAKDDNSGRLLVIKQLSQQILISGFTFSDGYADDFFGTVEIASSSPIFSWCTFENNENHGGFASGGAITITGFDGEAKPQFINCIFRNNFSNVLGGAVHSNDNNSNQTIFANCLFDGNEAVRGGAIHVGSGVVATFNCTFVNNTADKGSATYSTSGTATQHTNTIIWDSNNSPVMKSRSSVNVLVNYCIIRGGFSGTANLTSDPLFVSATDFQLKSNSPAIDKGSPSVDPDNLPSQDLAGGNRLTYGTLDLGAYEYQCQVQGTTITETVCDAYTSNAGNTYTESGTYTERFYTSNGCDSTVTLELTINTVDAGVTQNGLNLTADNQNATYQWVDCDDNYAPISGETGKTFTATVDGNYAVEVTANGCTKRSRCVQMMPSNVDVIFDEKSISVYPNPAQSQLFISHSFAGGEVYRIFSSDGRLMMSGLLEKGVANLNIAKLEAGLYYLRLSTGQRMFVKQ